MKAMVYTLFISLLFISCKQKRREINYTKIDPKDAYRMIRHYNDSAVSKKPGNLLRMIKFKNQDVMQLFYEKGTIIFWNAADMVTNQPTIIVEFDEEHHSPDPAPVYFSMEALGISICPPPNTPPCDATVPSS